jgi:SAM-dependent methyltransferase
VGWRLFNNAELYLNEPVNLWLCMLARGWINFGSTILDIGTGCGRFAHVLRDYRFAGGQFTGTYIGVDVDAEMLDWCRQNFPAEHFRYHLSPHQARTYGRPDAHAEAYRVPEADGSIDFVFSTSLFTHLLESELKNYVEEAARLLRPGGWMAGQCFVMERPPPTYGARHTFQHRIGNAMVESLARPEAAVAYHEAFLIETLHQAGFSNVSIQSSPGDWQCLLAGQKPPQA